MTPMIVYGGKTLEELFKAKKTSEHPEPLNDPLKKTGFKDLI